MEIYISKRSAENSKNIIKVLPILKYKILAKNSELLLAKEGEMEIEQGSPVINTPFLEIYKVQFIASCETELGKDLIVAFYVGEYFSLHTYVLDGLPGDYSQTGGSFKLLDYKSYSDICQLTGETKLSLAEYIRELEKEHVGINSFVLNNDKYLNKDEQKTLWKEYDSAKNALNNQV